MNAAPTQAPSRLAMIGAFASIYVIWGSTYLGMRVTVETVPPFAMAAARFILAGGLLYAFMRLRGAPAPKAHEWRDGMIVGTLLLLGGNGSVAWAVQFVPSGITALIIGASPLFMVLTEWAWPGGVRPGGGVLAAMLVGLAGIAWLAAPWETGSAPVHLGPLAVILAGCVSWSVGSIYSRHTRPTSSPFMASAVQMLCGSITLSIAALLHGDFARIDTSTISTRSWVAFGYLVLIGSLVGFSTFVWLLKHTTPARVSTYAYVNPVVAVFLGWAILDEPVTGRTLVASAIILGAVAIITTRRSRQAPVPPKSKPERLGMHVADGEQRG